MKTVHRILLVVLAFGLASACGTPVNMVLSSLPATPPSAGTARVHFFRLQQLMVATPIFDSNKAIGKFSPGEQFFVDLPAGAHRFALTTGQNEDVIDADLAPGRVYYVAIVTKGVVVIGGGVSIQRAFFVPISPGGETWAQKDDWLRSLRIVQMLPQGKVAVQDKHGSVIAQALAANPPGSNADRSVRPEYGVVSP